MTFAATKPVDYTGIYDLSTQREMHREAWNAHVVPHIWKRIMRDPRLLYDLENVIYDDQTIQYDRFDSTDHLYNEQILRRYYPPVKIRVFITKEPTTQDLKKLGVIEGKPAVAKFSTVILEDMKIPSRSVGIGDILEYEGHAYVLDTVIPDPASEWLCSGIHFILLCKLNTVDQVKI
jgi:hypothetical protein